MVQLCIFVATLLFLTCWKLTLLNYFEIFIFIFWTFIYFTKRQQQHTKTTKVWINWNALPCRKFVFSLCSCVRRDQLYSQQIRGPGMTLTLILPFNFCYYREFKLLNDEEKRLYVDIRYQLLVPREPQPMSDVMILMMMMMLCYNSLDNIHKLLPLYRVQHGNT